MEEPPGSSAVEAEAPNTLEDLSPFLTYLGALCPAALGARPGAFKRKLKKQNELLTKFACDPSVRTLVVAVGSRPEAGVHDGSDDGEEEGGQEFSLQLEVAYLGKNVESMMCFVKRGEVLVAGTPIAGQLHFVTLANDKPFETLYAYLRTSFGPLFESFLDASASKFGGSGPGSGPAGSSGDKTDPNMGVAVVRKNLASLQSSLMHLKQEVEIPEVKLVIDGDIARCLDEAAAAGRAMEVGDLGELVKDSRWLNSLQSGVNAWIREVQKVTKLERDASTGSALQEINFWLSMERALDAVEAELATPGVEMTMEVLKHAKRFHATVSFRSDTGLKAARAVVTSYNLLFKDFPIHELLNATDINSLNDGLSGVFNHLKKLKNTSYPLERALRFVEALSRDVAAQLLSVLQGARLLLLPYDEFDVLTSDCGSVFALWEDLVAGFKELLREVAKFRRNKAEESLPIRIRAEHTALRDRLEDLRRFRKQHDELRVVIRKVLPQVAHGSEINAVEEVAAAYDEVKAVEPLDVSETGVVNWNEALHAYESRIDAVESQITNRLRDKLGSAKNANEMFRVFQKFNALFFRPRIRGAIQEYQAQLISRVKGDITALQDKFKTQYGVSEVSRMSRLRDLPPVAGNIIWARQIERQLDTYMNRVETVLGSGWEQHVEGQKLKVEGDSFRRKLNTAMLFNNWVKQTESRNYEAVGRVFYIEKRHSKLTLRTNFDGGMITLFKEVRNLLWLGFRVPFQIQLTSSRAQQVYPFAVSLMESIKTYSRSCEKLSESIAPLVASFQLSVQTTLADGFQLHWESLKLDEYVKTLAETVLNFQEKVDDLLVKYETINSSLASLASAKLEQAALAKIVGSIQDVVDSLNMAGYSNLDAYVASLDTSLREVLTGRLREAVDLWIKVFTASLPSLRPGAEGASAKDDAAAAEDERKKARARALRARRFARPRGGDDGAGAGESVDPAAMSPAALTALRASMVVDGKPCMEPVVHELSLRNQTMYLEPPLESARQDWIDQFNTWLGVVGSLPVLSASRFDVMGVAAASGPGGAKMATYADLLSDLEPNELTGAYEVIEGLLAEARRYVDSWLQYQSLWDMDASAVHDVVRDDLGLWRQLLREIQNARSTFDNADSEYSLGSIVVQYGQVQAKVNNKYDAWHKEFLAHFGSLLGSRMADFLETLAGARAALEGATVETESTADAVAFITTVQKHKRKLDEYKASMEHYKLGQKLAERQRFHFPADWVHYDRLDGEFTAFVEILNRKDASIESQVPALQKKILAEERMLAAKLSEVEAEWTSSKPVSGEMRPDEANNVIAMFEGRVTKLAADFARIVQAMDALDLDAPSNETIESMAEELADLKGVWEALGGVWSGLDELKTTPWKGVVPKALRRSLNSLINELKGMPNRMRQYEAWEYVKGYLESLVKANSLIEALSSDAVHERHWKVLRKALGVRWASDFTLGEVWDADVLGNADAIGEVVTMAQGEKGLEEFLREVKEFWTEFALELVVYQGKTRLIRGWDDLFNKLMEHLNSVQAMKMSPYFKPFAEEAQVWDERLSRMQDIFDLWIDVQRRWVYLEGIFTGSADIKVLLPQESKRFDSINSEFLGLMKKVTKAPLILDVIAISGVDKLLARLADLLTKVQKALGEYLERQRASFPRFYFVGDEDLLEIIGNSKDVFKVQKHLKKMFAGLTALILDDDAPSLIRGMMSKEGEVVPFAAPVDAATMPKINEWLSALEAEMKNSLALLLTDAVVELRTILAPGRAFDEDAFFTWVETYPDQLVTLAAQCVWTEQVEAGLEAAASDEYGAANAFLETILSVLAVLAQEVLSDMSNIKRKKLEHLITELVHQRDTIRKLVAAKVPSASDFGWLYEMRYYFDETKAVPVERFAIRMANAEFLYGFEYLGIQSKLVTTPLTDRCYLTLTQALHGRMGGSPFGPAGTGKTESVKALGSQLGRFVLVFCCDENFDFQAMGRIFVGLCQVGAWGCFDEFNRLAERMLSAVSQQIQTIQLALQDGTPKVELLGTTVPISPDMGIFITMNPGYAGRSNLPDNLKQLFRPMAMTAPDKELIGQVMLFSQGFATAERLAGKVVPLFKLCHEQLSDQSHYDFGLRSLKSVLVSAGNIKRKKMLAIASGDEPQPGDNTEFEQDVLLQSICETLIPKLVAADIPLLYSLLTDVFPGCALPQLAAAALKAKMKAIADEANYVFGDLWVDKTLQLNQILNLNHGVMLVGPSGSGKSSSWRTLLAALEALEGVEGCSYVIDAKAISKDELYGFLDATTREWTDGIFTGILRRIIDNVRGEAAKRHWIVFDGDVDPEWVENMNSLLDDNKLLTLPNGERLALPPNVRIMFEVQDLKYATLATVSRTGMVWYSEDTLTTPMILQHNLLKMRNVVVPGEYDESDLPGYAGVDDETGAEVSPALMVQREVEAALAPYFADGSMVLQALDKAAGLEQVMDHSRLRLLGAMFSILNMGIAQVHEYNATHYEAPMGGSRLADFMRRKLVLAVVWGFSGSCKIAVREEFSHWLRDITDIDLPEKPVIDYEVSVVTGGWELWTNQVPVIDVDAESMGTAVIPTLDTVRHVDILYAWLAEHKPLLLCGPPGSGKTMTLFSTLRKATNYDVCAINFSSATSPELILSTFEQKCEIKKTARGLVLQPIQLGKWLVVFCDEINLPEPDEYGTQRVITFIRQLVEQGGYWRAEDLQWISLERIQFVGACNPPTDPGRTPLSHRFLRHAPLILCDYPAYESLTQIYGTFSRALLADYAHLKPYAGALTECMVDFYTQSQARFTADIQQHYIYSPRELTRWVRGIYDALRTGEEGPSLETLMRIWAHEGLRLFQDRLVTEEEREWTTTHLDATLAKHCPDCDASVALARPILFSSWLSDDSRYVSVTRDDLRAYLLDELKNFYEEELDVPLVLFDEVLDHILRIDRVFHQKQGHLLQIGQSGAGKTVLSRFVAWKNGLSVFQIRGSNKYSGEDFDNDLRTVLRRSGAEGEKICFIFDESNIKDTGFLERMNTLLANGEIPGLFEGDDWTSLMNQCKTSSQTEGKMLSSEDELYEWFTNQIIRNLHVVFTMNPAGGGFENRTSTSPALFNRCVLNWFGDWSDKALYQVGLEFTAAAPNPPTHRQAIVNAMVSVHQSVAEANVKLSKRQGRVNYVTPRHYLDFIHHYVGLYNEKRGELEEQQAHLNTGLDKLRETEEQVLELQKSLAVKNTELAAKNEEANAKLKQMVKDQQVAEEKKKESLKMAAELEAKSKVVEEQKEVALGDLAKAEPMVEEARAAVQGIKKSHLDEVRALRNPPAKIQLTMEAVLTLLGAGKIDWKGIKAAIQKTSFISDVMSFDAETISPRIRAVMEKKYLSNPEFNFESINKASKACGPLCKWALAQLAYADILHRVEPLRAELRALEADAAAMAAKKAEMDDLVAELEASIAAYKEEYGVLIGETQRIKTEMEVTKVKVERSTSLLASLGSERSRWEAESEGFRNQLASVVGDVLVCAATMAYAGFFDQSYRSGLEAQWKAQLEASNVAFNSELAFNEFLGSAAAELEWQSRGLPVDALCTQNAIMLERYNRYPLIIDPSGQATEFVMAQYAGRKMKKTSFLDPAFMKHLESALRFGTSLLVQDVENIDPVVNPVLNKELQKKGGRVLMQLGELDIDFSPSFSIFLSTRDPTFNFAPDLCSRVTFVNFTCLSKVLKAERPDIDAKRSDLLKLQGEFRVKLRAMEAKLLTTLSESEGNILDNDKVITTLEKIKADAADIAQKASEADVVMEEVEGVSSQYAPMATSCSRIYFSLEQMGHVHFLYQYSLQFFLDIFEVTLLHNPHLEALTEPMERLEVLMADLFATVYERVCRGLLHADHVCFAFLLAQVRTESAAVLDAQEFEFFLKGIESLGGQVPELGVDVTAPALGYTPAQQHLLRGLSALPIFAGALGESAVKDVEAWAKFLDLSAAGEKAVPPGPWNAAPAGAGMPGALVAFRKLLLVKAFRPDRLLAAMDTFVSAVFGSGFLDLGVLDLGKVVGSEVAASTPLLMCSMPGHDASGRVDEVAAEVGKRVNSIAIGSPEGFDLAENAISAAAKSGGWVMLKNVHLAPQWLVQLEKKLHNLAPVSGFRLFMTGEIHPAIPVNLMRMSRIFVFEPPPGVKANLLRTFSSIPASRMDAKPVERSRLYFIISWVHAVLQERLGYTPLGWAQSYEFNDADIRCAFASVDYWVGSVAKSKDNVDPEKIPWLALRTLFSVSIYGGRIDNEFDSRLLDSFLENLFTPASFNLDFVLVPAEDSGSSEDDEGDASGSGSDAAALTIPEARCKADFEAWVRALPDSQTPAWLGLPVNAESVLLRNKAKVAVSKILKLQSMQEDESVGGEAEAAAAAAASGDGSGVALPAWMRSLHTSLQQWSEHLPAGLTSMTSSAENVANPLFRCIERENERARSLLGVIRKDVADLDAVCRGEMKQTNHIRELLVYLSKGMIPKSWRAYSVPDSLSVNVFVKDLALRLQQLEDLAGQASTFGRDGIILGRLFSPEAFLTASRQAAAQAKEWPLEELELAVYVGEESGDDLQSFAILDLNVEGAEWREGALHLSEKISTTLPVARFRWVNPRVEDVPPRRLIRLPVYLNSSRKVLLFDVQVDGPQGLGDLDFAQRGIAIVATSYENIV
ncbi:cytoplasmic dynein [Thecamonas trahens ATCC 50062]|uniref:Dynein heavy chain, cytoplasmic n=1 Tax=Thecamonas trahens ATCC 50062 TaxID=461836 RepID=A0A0L0DKC0_THETB|nr:cytoplasmic dynein [Thecamonas trahens ATCC 50062]KNC52645.1 cytoplasmic dynein [Thecamonas trahens ATCC 50062]|eukprot:XP_013755196.1 cytoplasmic dynein [Thecamonas trahens ATCC 50062]